ncbi:MAG: hypothetical protein KJ615_11600, partial [Bacteroidetes bacterium]|nr:hypothetical protein [Bacteroidota bacterium]
ITELIGRIDQITGYINTQKPEDVIIHKLKIVQNEIQKLHEQHQLPAFSGIDNLVLSNFSPAVADAAKLYLQQQKDDLIKQNNLLRNEKDRIVRSLNQGREKNYLFSLKQKNHNKALEDLVMNTMTNEYFRETDNSIMQKIAPIYKKPDFDNGRAHFLSAEKVVAGVTIDTFVFNLGIIWLMSLVLYLALYFDWLRKSMERIGRIKLKR